MAPVRRVLISKTGQDTSGEEEAEVSQGPSTGGRKWREHL